MRERGLKGVSQLRDALDASLRDAAVFNPVAESAGAARTAAVAAAAQRALPSAAHPVRENRRIIALESARLVNVQRDAGFRADPLRALKEHLAARISSVAVAPAAAAPAEQGARRKEAARPRKGGAPR